MICFVYFKRDLSQRAPLSRRLCGEAWAGGDTRRLDVEQLSAHPHGGTWNRADRVGVDGEAARTDGDQTSSQGQRATPPYQNQVGRDTLQLLDGPPALLFDQVLTYLSLAPDCWVAVGINLEVC